MLISIHIYIYTLNWSECSMDSVFLGRLADRCDESGEDILAASSYGLAWMIWMCFLCTESRSHLFNSTCLQSPQNFGRCKMYLLWWSLWSINIYIYIYIYLYINYISWCDMLFSVHLLVRMSPSDVPIVLNAATMQFAIPMHIIASTAPRNCLLINSWLICLALWWLQIALPIFSAKALQIKFCLRGFRISDLEASSWWIWFEY